MKLLRLVAAAVCLLLGSPLSWGQMESSSVPNLTFTTIDVPGAGFTYVSGINSAGDIVGTYGMFNNGFEGHGFLLKNGTFTYFDYPGAVLTYTGAINDLGVIVGTVQAAGIGQAGYVYDGLTFTTFSPPGQPKETAGYGINNAGIVVGSSGASGAAVRAFELQKGRYRRIDLPINASYKQAFGINNLNEIAAGASSGIDKYAFVYRKGNAKQLNFPGTTGVTIASGINDYAIVVGTYFVFGDGLHGFAFRNGKFLSFKVPGAMETYAVSVNNAGQIVGGYELPDYSEHGFVTSPITSADFERPGCCLVDSN